jgi:hypothetical protein
LTQSGHRTALTKMRQAVRFQVNFQSLFGGSLMKSSSSAARSRGTRVLGIMAVASLLSGLLSSFAFSAEPAKGNNVSSSRAGATHINS